MNNIYKHPGTSSRWLYAIALIATAALITAACDSYTIKTFTVKFETNGGSAVADQLVIEGKKLSAVTTTKTGSDFEGWYTTSAFDSGSEWDFDNDIVAGNMTLYAKWSGGQTYTVTFEVNGGSAVADKTVASGGTIGSITCTKSGYNLEGWYTTSTLDTGTKWNLTSDPVTGDMTLYAKWTASTGATYTVTFNVGGGSAVASQTITAGGLVNDTLIATTKTGYVVEGWYKKNTFAPVDKWNFATSTVTGTMTLYVKWKTVPLTSIQAIEDFLDAASGGAIAADPVELNVKIDLGNMGPGTGWADLLDVLLTKDQFVNLDLSGCSMTGTAFNPNAVPSTLWPLASLDLKGKNKIVTIVLPDVAESITNGPGSVYSTATFAGFTALKSFDAANLEVIGNNAFNSPPGSVNPDSVIIINMTSLPASVKTIGNYAFYQCVDLALTSLPSEVDTIGISAFYGCANLVLTSLPSGVTEIKNSTFEECTGITSFTVHSGVTDIGNKAFYKSNLALITVPASVESIGTYAFSDTKLVSVSLPGVKTIGANAFYNIGTLTSVALPAVETIGADAFNSCIKLASVTLLAVQNIGDYAFKTTLLVSIDLPATMVSIGIGAFQYCSLLTTVICRAIAVPTLGSIAFDGCSVFTTIKVPAASKAAYQLASNWNAHMAKFDDV